MWVSRARMALIQAEVDYTRQINGLLAAEREAHQLTRHALALKTEQAKALDDRLTDSRRYIAALEADLAKAAKGSWRWTDKDGDHSATS